MVSPHMLSNQNYVQIQQIAEECGYDSLCSFNRNFKHFVHSRFLLRVILAAPADAVCILRCFCFGIVL